MEAKAIIIADDHSIVRKAIGDLLTDCPLIEDIYEARTLPDAHEIAERNGDVGLFILDLYMDGMDGISGIERTRKRFPSAKLAILTGYPTRQLAEQALDAGAVGFLSKELTGEVIVKAIELMLVGGRYIPLDLTSELRGPAQTKEVKRPEPTLTHREQEIWALAKQPHSNEEIAALLGLGATTVKMHLRNIYRKLGAEGRAHARQLRKGTLG